MALYKRGKTYWLSYTTPDGKRIRCSTGTENRQEAQQLFDKLKHESWQQASLGAKKRHTWDEAALLWIKERADKKSLKDDIIMLRWITPRLRGYYLDEITRPIVAQIGEIKKAESSAARANRHLALIRAILNRAYKVWDWLEKVPSIQLYPENKKRVRFLTPNEIEKVTNELPVHQRPIFLFSILTGLRRSNVLNLRWSQVSFESDLIVIDGEEMKAGKTHSVPISDSVRDILIAQIGKNPEFVFTYKGKPIKETKRAFQSALKKAGINDYRWHDNRHTWASLLVQNGVPLNEIQEMGAWSSEAMVKRYAHLSPQKLRKNAEIVDKKISNSVTILSQIEKEKGVNVT